jgi:hypothetical protein
LRITVKLTVQNRQAKIEVLPSASSLVIRALKEPPRDKKKVKNIKCPVDRAQIWSDISSLQLAHSPENFKMATELFIKKWKQKKMPDVTTFIEYMDDHWIKINSNWYEGAAPGYPSSNNALESTNNDIKNSFTFRERLPMNEFLELLLKIVNHVYF